MLTFVLVVIWVGTAGSVLLFGLDYYLLPLSERAFSPLAPLFAPTGLVGQGMGVVGSAFMLIGVAGYAARKRLAFLHRAGALRDWLKVHIFLCTLGPFLVLLHTTFKFGGIVSIAFWSMAVVVVSGVFGRYVYVRIPKSVNGRFLGLQAIRERAATLTDEISARAGIPTDRLSSVLAAPDVAPRANSLLGAVVIALRADVRGRRHLRSVRGFLKTERVPRTMRGPILDLAREQRRLHQQMLLLQPFQRLFRYWHVLHLPLATVMFLVLGVHVAVAILFGYTWIF
jgi:hypothetical protein